MGGCGVVSVTPGMARGDGAAAGGGSRAETGFARAFLWARLTWLGLGLVTQLRERSGLRRPRVADVVFATAAVETVWSTARTYRDAPLRDRSVARTDVAVGALVHWCACAAAGSGERFWLATDWAFTLSLLNVGAAGSALSVGEGVGWLVPVSGLYGLAIWRRDGDDATSTVVTNVLTYAIWFGVVASGMNRIRRTESELALFSARAAEDAARLAGAREREGIERELHTQTRAALSEIVGLIETDRPTARRVARQAALRLRAALMSPDTEQIAAGRDHLGGGVGGLFARLSKEAARVGIGIETVDDIHAAVPAAELAAAGAGLRGVFAALDDNAADAKIVVRAATVEPDGWSVTVRVRPPGGIRDSDALEHELAGLLEPVGGAVEVIADPGYGVRVELSMRR